MRTGRGGVQRAGAWSRSASPASLASSEGAAVARQAYTEQDARRRGVVGRAALPCIRRHRHRPDHACVRQTEASQQSNALASHGASQPVICGLSHNSSACLSHLVVILLAGCTLGRETCSFASAKPSDRTRKQYLPATRLAARPPARSQRSIASCENSRH